MIECSLINWSNIGQLSKQQLWPNLLAFLFLVTLLSIFLVSGMLLMFVPYPLTQLKIITYWYCHTASCSIVNFSMDLFQLRLVLWKYSKSCFLKYNMKAVVGGLEMWHECDTKLGRMMKNRKRNCRTCQQSKQLPKIPLTYSTIKTC